MNTITRVISVVISLLLLACPFYFSIGARGFLGDQFDITGYVLVAALLYLGILFGALHRQLLSGAGDVSILPEIRTVFASRHFWISIAGSPLVLLGVYAILREKPVDIAALALTFQNGFFCERLVASINGTKSIAGVTSTERH